MKGNTRWLIDGYGLTREEFDVLASEPRLRRREVEILRARSGFYGPKQTLATLAARLGVSSVRVREIEVIAGRKMVRPVAGCPFKNTYLTDAEGVV